jgi:hypothetical protein
VEFNGKLINEASIISVVNASNAPFNSPLFDFPAAPIFITFLELELRSNFTLGLQANYAVGEREG